MQQPFFYRLLRSTVWHLFFCALHLLHPSVSFHQEATSANTLPARARGQVASAAFSKEWIGYNGVMACILFFICLESFLFPKRLSQISMHKHRLLDLIGLFLYIVLLELITRISHRWLPTWQKKVTSYYLNHHPALFFLTAVILPALCWTICWIYGHAYWWGF